MIICFVIIKSVSECYFNSYIIVQTVCFFKKKKRKKEKMMVNINLMVLIL